MFKRRAAGKLRRANTLEEYNIIIDQIESVREGLEKPNFKNIKMLNMYCITNGFKGLNYLLN